ncbi:MAG: TetR/AcrR family transcriptional regulator [Pseudonocardiales bacterium]|nr:TetR/AcrR family transcriptional regulator [Pseudonocardiales bacterium]
MTEEPVTQEPVTEESHGRPRGRPRKDSGPAPIDDVLAAALHAFATHGYQGVSVRTLNRELGVSHNLLHQRFGSKEAIWYAAVDWGFGRLTEELVRSGQNQPDPVQRLRAFIRSFVAFSARNPDLLRVANSEGGTATERLDYLLRTYVRPTMERMVPTYRELVESKRARPVPPEAIYYLITSGAGAMYSNEAMTRSLFPAEVLDPDRVEAYAESVTNIIMNGLIQ